MCQRVELQHCVFLAPMLLLDSSLRLGLYTSNHNENYIEAYCLSCIFIQIISCFYTFILLITTYIGLPCTSVVVVPFHLIVLSFLPFELNSLCLLYSNWKKGVFYWICGIQFILTFSCVLKKNNNLWLWSKNSILLLVIPFSVSFLKMFCRAQ